MSMKNKTDTRKFFPGILFLFVFLLFFDQITKYISSLYLSNTSGKILIPGILKFYYLENKGAAFGILKNQTVLFMILVVLLILLYFYFYRRVPKTNFYSPLILTGILLLAGAVGNAIDRIFYPGVRDFIYVTLIDFPVFNIADIYIVVSCILLVLLLCFYYKDEDLKFIKGGEK